MSASATLASAIALASRVASRTISAASASAVEMYLRPRDSAPAKILRALFSALSSVSFAARFASLTRRSDADVAFASRAWADLIIAMAVSVARISNSSRLNPVMSRRARRSASWFSNSRMRSTGLAMGARSSSSRKPTQLRNFLSAMGARLGHVASFGKWRMRPLNIVKSMRPTQRYGRAHGIRSTLHFCQGV